MSATVDPTAWSNEDKAASYAAFQRILNAPSPDAALLRVLHAPSPPAAASEDALPPKADGDGTVATRRTPDSGAGVAVVRGLLLGSALLLALTPSLLKLYETSHWFREGDPSAYDAAKDWFANPDLPLQGMVDNPKVLMRLYFFVLPYVAMGVCLVLVHLLPRRRPSPDRQEDGLPRPLTGGCLVRAVSLPRCLVWCGAPAVVSAGEVLGVLAFLLVNLGTVAVRVRRSLPRGTRKNLYLVDAGDAGREDIPGLSWPAVEVWGKTLGVISIVNLGWYLLMPVGRKSILLEALGMKWERAIKYHRWVAFYSVALMLAHGACYIAVLVHGDGHPRYGNRPLLRHNLVAWGCASDGECDEDQVSLLRINMYGIVSLVLVLAITVFAVPFFRRKHFEWFFYVHHLFALVLLFVCLHYKGAVIYLTPGLAVYAIDKLMGLRAYKNCACARTQLVTSDILEVTFDLDPAVQYRAGQYVFVNVPSVSQLQWHPYSLSSGPNANPGKLIFHIKKVDDSPNCWTRQVLEQAAAGDGTLDMRIDAFYGDYGHNLQKNKAVQLVGAGIGITPMISVGLDLVLTQPKLPVTITWICSSVYEFNIFARTLHDAQIRSPNLSVKVWITLNHPEPGITKSSLRGLTNDEKSDRIIGMLPTPACPEEGAKGGGTFLFRTTPPGLEAGGSAGAMLLAMVLGLLGYTVSVQVARERDIAPQDIVTLVDMALVVGLILLAFAIAVLVQRSAFRCEQDRLESATATPDVNGTAEAEDHRKDVLGSTAMSNNRKMADTGSDQSDSPEPGTEGLVNEDVFRAMLRGRVGCRPNFEAEFTEALENHHDNEAILKKIRVIACGPKALTSTLGESLHNSTRNLDDTLRSRSAQKLDTSERTLDRSERTLGRSVYPRERSMRQRVEKSVRNLNSLTNSELREDPSLQRNSTFAFVDEEWEW